jgi:hypothetical protein
MVKDFPHLMKLPGDEVPEDGVNIGAGVKVALRPDFFYGRIVIPQLRMVEDQVHELGERNPAAIANPFPDDLDQFFILWSGHVCYYNATPPLFGRCPARNLRQYLGLTPGYAGQGSKDLQNQKPRSKIFPLNLCIVILNFDF